MCRRSYLGKVAALFLMSSTPVITWAAGGYVLDAVGPVSIAADKKLDPRPAQRNDVVASGTVIRTGDNGHAVVKFEDGQVISMQANTTFLVREYRYIPEQIEESSIVFSMYKGGMRFVGGQIAKRYNQAFRLATPDATVRIRESEFMVVIADDGTFSKVLSGNIDLTNAVGSSVMSPGQISLTPSSTDLTTAVPASLVPVAIFGEIAAISVFAAE